MPGARVALYCIANRIGSQPSLDYEGFSSSCILDRPISKRSLRKGQEDTIDAKERPKRDATRPTLCFDKKTAVQDTIDAKERPKRDATRPTFMFRQKDRRSRYYRRKRAAQARCNAANIYVSTKRPPCRYYGRKRAAQARCNATITVSSKPERAAR